MFNNYVHETVLPLVLIKQTYSSLAWQFTATIHPVCLKTAGLHGKTSGHINNNPKTIFRRENKT